MAQATHDIPIECPATQAERDLLQVKRIKAKFDWSNDEWAAQWLPWVRVAAVHVAGDQDRVEEFIRGLVKSGEASHVLQGLAQTRLHLADLCELLDAALARSFRILEGFGYSPDDLPETPTN
jgi:hypothetical protein